MQVIPFRVGEIVFSWRSYPSSGDSAREGNGTNSTADGTVNEYSSHDTVYYRGGVISWVRGSERFVLKFAFPLSPLWCRFQNKTCTEPLTQ